MESAGSYAIDVQHLCKVFGSPRRPDQTIAVSDLTLRVGRGEVFGFLGPNGAGKTTALKMFLGLVRPTAGQGEILGHTLGDPAGRAKVGFLPEHFRFHEWLTAIEFLTLQADLYHLPRPISRQRIPELLDLVALSAHAGKKLRTFSKGMLQRIGLAQALLNDPELVLLDEPTSGLDPMGRRLVRDIIRDLRGKGTTVFLNSHLLSEVEVTCDRVAFIRKGEVVYTSALDALVDGGLVVQIRVRRRGMDAHAADAGIPDGVVGGLQRWGDNVRVEGDRITLSVRSEADLPDIARYLLRYDLDLYALAPQRVSLEDLFIQIVGTDSQEGA
ncbi:MAG: ABC transporter ATP-binding protein [Anaerolineae bacterium]|nr:ABC transporter ATP-binding protein [Anaerolineae bacterium]